MALEAPTLDNDVDLDIELELDDVEEVHCEARHTVGVSGEIVMGGCSHVVKFLCIRLDWPAELAQFLPKFWERALVCENFYKQSCFLGTQHQFKWIAI